MPLCQYGCKDSPSIYYIYTLFENIRAYMHIRAFTYIYIHTREYTYVYIHIRAYMLKFILGYAPSNRGLEVFWSGGSRHSMAAGCNPVRQISYDRQEAC